MTASSSTTCSRRRGQRGASHRHKAISGARSPSSSWIPARAASTSLGSSRSRSPVGAPWLMPSATLTAPSASPAPTATPRPVHRPSRCQPNQGIRSPRACSTDAVARPPASVHSPSVGEESEATAASASPAPGRPGPAAGAAAGLLPPAGTAPPSPPTSPWSSAVPRRPPSPRRTAAPGRVRGGCARSVRRGRRLRRRAGAWLRTRPRGAGRAAASRRGTVRRRWW